MASQQGDKELALVVHTPKWISTASMAYKGGRTWSYKWCHLFWSKSLCLNSITYHLDESSGVVQQPLTLCYYSLCYFSPGGCGLFFLLKDGWLWFVHVRKLRAAWRLRGVAMQHLVRATSKSLGVRFCWEIKRAWAHSLTRSLWKGKDDLQISTTQKDFVF